MFPPTTPLSLQATIPSYVYQEYSDDDDLQAFAASYNALVQQYVDWFNTINLPVYTGAQISGPLLDWVATGLYGLPRPVIPGASSQSIGLLATYLLAQLELAQYKPGVAQAVYPVNDDIYKRVLTWLLYKGDGVQFTTRWLKRRVMRFLVGVDGVGYAGGTQIIDGLIVPANLEDIRSTQATYTTMAGALAIAAANVPRVDWSTDVGALLFEGASTNAISNPMALGATAGVEGSGGALPTNWTWRTTPPLTWQVVQSITEDGIGCIDLRVFGVPSSSTAMLEFDATPLTINQQAASCSFYARTITGTLTNIKAIRPCLRYVTAASAYLSGDISTSISTLSRVSMSHTRLTTDTVFGAIQFLFNDTVTSVDYTIRLGGAQLEAFPAPTSLTLPPTGTVAVSNRAADYVTYPTGIDNTYPVSVTYTGRVVTIAITGFSSIKPLFAAAVASGVLPLPPQFTYVVT